MGLTWREVSQHYRVTGTLLFQVSNWFVRCVMKEGSMPPLSTSEYWLAGSFLMKSSSWRQGRAEVLVLDCLCVWFVNCSRRHGQPSARLRNGRTTQVEFGWVHPSYCATRIPLVCWPREAHRISDEQGLTNYVLQVGCGPQFSMVPTEEWFLYF